MSQAVFANEVNEVEGEIVFVWTKSPRNEIRREPGAVPCAEADARPASNGREGPAIPSAD